MRLPPLKKLLYYTVSQDLFSHAKTFIYFVYNFFKNFFRRCWKLLQQALNDRCQTEAIELSKCLPTLKIAPHATRFQNAQNC